MPVNVVAWVGQCGGGSAGGAEVDVSWPSGQTWAVGISVPPAVERLLTADVAREIAKTFGDSPVYPERVVVDSPAGHSRRFPGWPGPVLVLSDENQGVCSWGVPLDGSSHQVLVGGDLVGTGHATVAYAASVEDFIAARRWDCQCLRPPLLMAQAAGLDQASLEYLRARLVPAVDSWLAGATAIPVHEPGCADHALVVFWPVRLVDILVGQAVSQGVDNRAARPV